MGCVSWDILADDGTPIPDVFWVAQDDVERENGWMTHKGGRSVMRTSAEGQEYRYSKVAWHHSTALRAPSPEKVVLRPRGSNT